MTDRKGATARRTFLGRLATAALPVAALGFFPRSLAAATRAGAVEDHPTPDWLRSLRAKHRTVFDVDAHTSGKVLGQARNFLDAWNHSFGVPDRDVNLVMAVRGTGIPIVLNDAVWDKLHIGEQYGITDPATKTHPTRNPFIAANVHPGGLVLANQTVEALQKRGALFLVCMNTVAAATQKLSSAGLGASDEVRRTILGGLLPGVIVVPAMVVAFTQMQEHRIAYVYMG